MSRASSPGRRSLVAPAALALVTLTGIGCGSASDDSSSGPTEPTAPDPARVEPSAGAATSGPGHRIPEEVGELGPPAAPSRCGAPDAALLENAHVPEGLCAWIWADGLARPRGMTVTDGGDVLVVERDGQRVTALHDDDGDRVISSDERTVLAEAPGLHHGIAVHDGTLYASSATTVYRWEYPAGTREPLGEPSVVVRGMPDGGHSTRTLVFDAEGRLYVNVGSGSNVDDDPARSRVMRYDLSRAGRGPIRWDEGETFAAGLRNECGLAFDAAGRLWGVQNGTDNLERDDLGGDIHADNPAEELNLFEEPGRFHGYPFCWTEYQLPEGVGRGRGTQWAHPQFRDDGTHTDDWCRDESNVTPPAFAMQAHTAPLDLLFWRGGALPDALVGDALVGMHGSWNRPEPVGYKVARLRFEGGRPQAVEDFLVYAGDSATGEGWHRPVDLVRGPRGELLVTSDSTGLVIAVARPAE